MLCLILHSLFFNNVIYLAHNYIGGGGHLYFRLDIILVKGLSKHTLNTHFSGMKIDPKFVFLHAFFLICPSCPFQNDQKHTLFSNFARFCTPKRCTRIHCLVLKNNPNYVNFFTRMISNFKYKWPPGNYIFLTFVVSRKYVKLVEHVT